MAGGAPARRRRAGASAPSPSPSPSPSRPLSLPDLGRHEQGGGDKEAAAVRAHGAFGCVREGGERRRTAPFCLSSRRRWRERVGLARMERGTRAPRFFQPALPQRHSNTLTTPCPLSCSNLQDVAQPTHTSSLTVPGGVEEKGCEKGTAARNDECSSRRRPTSRLTFQPTPLSPRPSSRANIAYSARASSSAAGRRPTGDPGSDKQQAASMLPPFSHENPHPTPFLHPHSHPTPIFPFALPPATPEHPLRSTQA